MRRPGTLAPPDREESAEGTRSDRQAHRIATWGARTPARADTGSFLAVARARMGQTLQPRDLSLVFRW
jgi:hypothetical protein